ncbi:chorismate synthase [bacterium]|nr:chorismate synthase [bacterium]
MQFVSAGESHGSELVAVLSGFPAGVRFDSVLFENDLRRRRSGLGRSERLDVEKDDVRVVSGVAASVTTGAPIAFLLKNAAEGTLIENGVIDKGFPRPGHADYSTFRKFGYDNISIGAERSSARETALRVAAGALCRMFLAEMNVDITSEILEIGGVPYCDFDAEKALADKANGTYGGVLKVVVSGIPAGLGSNVQWSDHLDSRLAAALISIPSVKGVYFGEAELHRMRGKNAADAFCGRHGERASNRCGGIEGGISNGMPLVATLYFKPIPTQPFEVESVSPVSGRTGKCQPGMNDLWCIERAGVIAESMAALIVADAFCEKFGSDNLSDIKSAYAVYLEKTK